MTDLPRRNHHTVNIEIDSTDVDEKLGKINRQLDETLAKLKEIEGRAGRLLRDVNSEWFKGEAKTDETP